MESVQVLTNLGFTNLEAEIYISLLQQQHATGYQVAKAIRKPTANVYKALLSLETKGAVFVEETEKKIFKAVSVSELLSQLNKQFQQHKNIAEETLNQLVTSQHDDKVYQLATAAQTMERCRQMLAECQAIAVIDAFPTVLTHLLPEIQNTIKRDVKVAINLYRDMDIPGARCCRRPDGDAIISRWPGEWINIVIDGSEYCIALLTRDLRQVIQAIWTESPYLSWVYYSALMSELQLADLSQQIQDGASHTELQKTLDEHNRFFPLDAPGYQKLTQRFEQLNIQENH